MARVVGGRPRLLRRARGYAPAALSLPPGFEAAPRVLGFGGELKNTFCMVGNGAAVLSPPSRRSAGCAHPRGLPAGARGFPSILRLRARGAGVRPASRLLVHPGGTYSSERFGRVTHRVPTSSRPHRRMPRRERRAARCRTGARRGPRRHGLRRGRCALGWRIPARRLRELPAARHIQTGRLARRRGRHPRTVAQHLRPHQGPNGVAQFRHEL